MSGNVNISFTRPRLEMANDQIVSVFSFLNLSVKVMQTPMSSLVCLENKSLVSLLSVAHCTLHNHKVKLDTVTRLCVYMQTDYIEWSRFAHVLQR